MVAKKRDKRLFEEEVVDFDYLMSLIEEDLRQVSTTDDLIDKFLELKDFRINIDEESAAEPSEQLEPFQSTYNDDIASEELAQIYHSQGLYTEAKDIYNKLFLLYSEKITYFATQIAKLTEKESERGEKEQKK